MMGLRNWFSSSASPSAIALSNPTLVPETELNRNELLQEFGGTGTMAWGNLLTQEDYNTDLQGGKQYEIYDKMRLADGTVRAGLNVVKLPLLAADWFVEPATETPRDVEIAQQIQDNLLDGMSASWYDTLRHVLLALDYGSMPFEKVWELRDGVIALRKLAPRMPKTVTNWLLDDHGGFAGIEQSVIVNNAYETIQIPSEKCLVFVNEREGSNFRGISVLRAAYKHWYMKDRMYIIDAITQEKRGLGVDVGKVKSQITPAQKSQAERALMGVRSHEKNYLIEPEWFDYRVEGLGRGSSRDGMPSIDHHDLQILRSIMAEFVAMTAGGSLAMHKDKSSFFLMALEGIGQMICETFNRYLIPQMVAYNFPGVIDYPKLTHSALDSRNVQEWATAVSTLLTGGVLTPDADIERAARTILNLPDLPDDAPPPPGPRAAPGSVASTGEGDDPDATTEEPGSGSPGSLRRLAGRSRPVYRNGGRVPVKKRGPVGLSTGGTRIDFNAMTDVLDKAEARILVALEDIQKRQVTTLTKIAESLVASGDLEKIPDIVVPYRKEFADAIFEVLSDLYAAGQKEVEKEFILQDNLLVFSDPLDAGDSKAVTTFLRFRSTALANLLADKLKSLFVWETLAQAKTGELDKAAFAASLNGLSNREAKKIAGGTVSEALNFGRETKAAKLGDRIQRVEYSALLDDGTCEPCNDADGKILKYGSREMEQYRPPYRLCEGKGNCRCVLIFMLEKR